MYKYKYTVSGGTFDQLHAGHKAFLRSQLGLSEKLLIGVTSDAYIQQNKKEQKIASYASRIEQLNTFFIDEQVLDRVMVKSIDDSLVPHSWQKYPIEAIIVTKETELGAKQINKTRKHQGLTPLEIVVVPHTIAEDGEIITASRIRKGEIDREGNSYIDPLWLHNTLVLPGFVRKQLQKPFGSLWQTIEDWLKQNNTLAERVISIGDEVTESLLQKKFEQKVAVVDLFVQRKKKYATVADHTIEGDEHILSIENPSGCITPELFKAAKTSIFSQGKYVVYINGEEDLAVLPFVLVAPLGFQIVYGQPGKGIVAVLVTHEFKKRAQELVEKFTILASK